MLTFINGGPEHNEILLEYRKTFLRMVDLCYQISLSHRYYVAQIAYDGINQSTYVTLTPRAHLETKFGGDGTFTATWCRVLWLPFDPDDISTKESIVRLQDAYEHLRSLMWGEMEQDEEGRTLQ